MRLSLPSAGEPPDDIRLEAGILRATFVDALAQEAEGVLEVASGELAFLGHVHLVAWKSEDPLELWRAASRTLKAGTAPTAGRRTGVFNHHPRRSVWVFDQFEGYLELKPGELRAQGVDTSLEALWG